LIAQGLKPARGKGAFVKNLITIVVVVVVALVAFNYFQTGKFSLLPGGGMSQEEKDLNRLKGEFRRATQAYRQAGRSAGVSGLDTTSDAAAALQTVDGVERDVKALRKRTKDPEVKAKIDDLLAEIKKYKEDVS
jgi:cytochrome c-type biogenesis protein CcmH/NrfG